jgi:hypothetical protein
MSNNFFSQRGRRTGLVVHRVRVSVLMALADEHMVGSRDMLPFFKSRGV